jgi:hypothetical protein
MIIRGNWAMVALAEMCSDPTIPYNLPMPVTVKICRMRTEP